MPASSKTKVLEHACLGLIMGLSGINSISKVDSGLPIALALLTAERVQPVR